MMPGGDWPERLWLVRHGQSAGNVARDHAEENGHELIELATRDADVPLSELGVRQSDALAEWFEKMPETERPDAFITSPFVRAHQTCTIVAHALGATPRDFHVDERLREKEFGVLDRYTVHGIKTKFPELAEQRALVGKFYFRPPGGESWCDVILRLRSVLEVLRRDYARRRVLLVSHQVIVNCFRYLLDELDEARILAIDREGDVPNCGITEYALDTSEDTPRFVLRTANLILPLIEAGEPVTSAKDAPVGPK